MKFKTDCPMCGGKKKFATKVDLTCMESKAKCHKCGHCLPSAPIVGGSVHEKWSPPSARSSVG